MRQKRDGREFLELTLADRTGRVTATIWDGGASSGAHVQAGVAVRVIGRFGSIRATAPRSSSGPCAVPRRASYDPADLLDGPPKPAAQMEAELRQLTATVRDPLPRGSCSTGSSARAPGAAGPRSATRRPPRPTTRPTATGCSSTRSTVAQAVSRGQQRRFRASTATSRSPARCCTTSASSTPTRTDALAIDMTDLGQLQGEISSATTACGARSGRWRAFPTSRAEALLHIVLSHHGSLEHGSPVCPCTREATLVHLSTTSAAGWDRSTGSRRSSEDGECWSGFDRALGGGAWFAAGATALPASPRRPRPRSRTPGGR